MCLPQNEALNPAAGVNKTFRVIWVYIQYWLFKVMCLVATYGFSTLSPRTLSPGATKSKDALLKRSMWSSNSKSIKSKLKHRQEKIKWNNQSETHLQESIR